MICCRSIIRVGNFSNRSYDCAARRPRRFLWLAAIPLIAALAACGGSSKNVQNQPPPPQSSVSIAFQPAPATSISLASSAKISAVVTDDPSNLGVDWALLCPANANCGQLSSLHTASGAPVTYTPPAVLTGNNQSFTIEAFATADHSKNLVTTITVTGFGASLKGTYVFETRGEDANGNYQLAGVIVLDGNGNITAGEQTHNDPALSVSDAITGGTYYVGPDGRGTLTINTSDQIIGQQGVENLSLVFLSNAKAYISTLDNPNLATPSFETSTGTMVLQTSTAAPTGGYAFVVNGVDITNISMAMGGVFNIDSPNTISGSHSIADQFDVTNGVLNGSATLSGTVTNPDSLGSLKFNLVTTFAPALQFTGYIVDATHIRLIESDNAGSGVGFGSTAGVAIAQGASTGTFTSGSAFAGNYVVHIVGQDPNNVPLSLASVGQITADASGNITGYDDEVLSAAGIDISDSLTATYTLDPAGTGRVDAIVTFTTNGPGPEWIFYITGNGNPPLVLDADEQTGSIALDSLGVGQALPQGAPPFTLSGKYGLKFSQSSSSFENNGTGQVTASGTPATLNGVIDVDFMFSPEVPSNISLSSSAAGANGRSTGSVTNTFFSDNATGTSSNSIPVAFYFVDSSLVYFIETDSALAGELIFGNLATRTPVCSGCQ